MALSKQLLNSVFERLSDKQEATLALVCLQSEEVADAAACSRQTAVTTTAGSQVAPAD